MVSKTLLLVGLFAVLLVVSEVAAASERQSGTVKSQSEETLHPDQLPPSYGGDSGHPLPPSYGGGSGHPLPPSYGGGSGPHPLPPSHKGGQPYCSYGCCYRGYYGCSKCCSYAGEAVQTQPGH